jgi:hypothetical protein
VKPSGRTKEKYNPTPSPSEKAHHLRVMALGCLICRGDAVAHHILQRSPHKHWRRDHQQVVPLCGPHHGELHGMGDEIKFEQKYGLDLAGEAWALQLESIHGGIL